MKKCAVSSMITSKYHLVICKQHNKLGYELMKYYIMVNPNEVIPYHEGGYNYFFIGVDCYSPFDQVTKEEFDKTFVIVDDKAPKIIKLEKIINTFIKNYDCVVHVMPIIEEEGFFFSYEFSIEKLFGNRMYSKIVKGGFSTYVNALQSVINEIKKKSISEYKKTDAWIKTFYVDVKKFK